MPSTIVKRLPELREQSQTSHQILFKLKKSEYTHRVSQRKWQLTGYSVLFALLGYLGYKGYQQGFFTPTRINELVELLAADESVELRTSLAGIGMGFYGLWMMPSDAKLDSLPEKMQKDIAKITAETAMPLPSANPTLQESIAHIKKINQKVEKDIDEVLSQRDVVKAVLHSKHSKNNKCSLYDSFWSSDICEPQVFNQIFSFMGFDFEMKESQHKRLELRAAKAESIIHLLKIKEQSQRTQENRGRELIQEGAIPAAATIASYLYSRQEKHSTLPFIATGLGSMLFMAYRAYQHSVTPSKATLHSLKPFEQKMVTDVLKENKLDTDLKQTLQHVISTLQKSSDACRKAIKSDGTKSISTSPLSLKTT